MHCKFKSSGQQKWLSKTSNNNVNAIYKGKNWYKNIQNLNITWHVRKKKIKLAERFITQGLIYITQSSGVSLEHNFQNTFKYIQLRSLLPICCSTNHVQHLFSLRQNNSSNNTASTSLNTMSSIWRDFFRKNRFFFPHLVVI